MNLYYNLFCAKKDGQFRTPTMRNWVGILQFPNDIICHLGIGERQNNYQNVRIFIYFTAVVRAAIFSLLQNVFRAIV